MVEEDGGYLLVDMGGSARATNTALQQMGLQPDGLRGILITHEHSDHIKGLAVFLKRQRVPLVAASATLQYLWDAGAVPQDVDAVPCDGRPLEIGGFAVTAFPTSHDAVQSCGYHIVTPGSSVCAVATDLGKMTADVFVKLETAALVALEANYDPDMLRFGPYPAKLKSRIASVKGHLSNRDAAAAAVQLLDGGCQKLVMCHLSEENNTPRHVRSAIEMALKDAAMAMPKGCEVHVARRYNPIDWVQF